jgi:hypothetical protein
VVRHVAWHREATEGANREGHGNLARSSILGGGLRKPQGGDLRNAYRDRQELVEVVEQRRGWSMMIFCARATRGLTTNLDLSLGLPNHMAVMDENESPVEVHLTKNCYYNFKGFAGTRSRTEFVVY